MLLQKRMDEKKITLQEFAEILGYKNASTALKFLRGDYQFKAYHVPIILNHLEMTMEEFFFEDQFVNSANIG